jgi:hypothetical protein
VSGKGFLIIEDDLIPPLHKLFGFMARICGAFFPNKAEISRK